MIIKLYLKAGYTWESLNDYENPAVSVILRYSQVTLGLSTVLNPIIYLYVYRDLRIGFVQLFCKRGRFSWEEDTAVSLS